MHTMTYLGEEFFLIKYVINLENISSNKLEYLHFGIIFTCKTVMYFSVRLYVAKKQDNIKTNAAKHIDATRRFVASVNDNHSMVTKTGISRVTIPNNGKNRRKPDKPNAARTNPNIVADCELIIHI